MVVAGGPVSGGAELSLQKSEPRPFVCHIVFVIS